MGDIAAALVVGIPMGTSSERQFLNWFLAPGLQSLYCDARVARAVDSNIECAKCMRLREIHEQAHYTWKQRANARITTASALKVFGRTQFSRSSSLIQAKLSLVSGQRYGTSMSARSVVQ